MKLSLSLALAEAESRSVVSHVSAMHQRGTPTMLSLSLGILRMFLLAFVMSMMLWGRGMSIFIP